MDNIENNINQKDLEFPSDLNSLTKEECAKILHKALATSGKYSSITQLAEDIGFKRQTLGDYFYARHKPPQEKWNLLREVLFEGEKNDSIETKKNVHQTIEARHSAERLKAIAFLFKDELEYFKESLPEGREILKEYLPGPTSGYIASLLMALYNENQLEIFKNFSKK